MSRKFSSNHRERYHYSKTANTPPPKQSVTSIEPLIDIIVVILDGEYSKKEVKQVIDHYFNYLRS